MIEVENTDVNIVRNLIPMRNHMPASAYGLKAISDWFNQIFFLFSEVGKMDGLLHGLFPGDCGLGIFN